MINQYDAIIIGSGLGGLTAAATLAKNGRKVAVFERHNQPGGYATTFFRDDFEFEVSLHAMSGVGTPKNPGPLRGFLESLGIVQKVNFIPMGDLYRTIADGIDITVPHSPEKAISVLTEAFPHETDGIRTFIEQVMTVGMEVQMIREGGYTTSPLPTLARFPNLAHAAGTTVADVMDRLISDEKVKLVLGQLWGYFGLPPAKLSFLLFAAGVSTYLRWGSVTIEGKSQSLSNAYAEVVRESGGEVHLSEGVKEILVEDGRVIGVVSDKNIRYNTSIVVSNADPFSTLNRLISPAHVAPKYKRRLEAASPSVGAVTLYLGLNRPSREVGIEDHELYINLDQSMDVQWEKCTSLAAPGVLSVCAYDNSNPHFAPAGKGVLAITILQLGDAWTSLDESSYALEKERYSEMLLGIIDTQFPGVRHAVATKVLSTPVTNVRYTGNPQGAIYGFANTPEENPGFRLGNRGPLEGLWFAGAWTRPGAGYQGVITSGYNTATDILNDQGLQNELPWGIGATKSKIKASVGRRWNGWKLIVRDGKRIGKVIRSKYRKYDNSALDTDFVSTYDRSSRFHAPNVQMKVVSRKVETFDTVTLRLFSLAPPAFDFSAGQYVDITADIRGERVTRAYSVSSSPTQKAFIDVTVKAQAPGKMSPYLVNDVHVGDTLSVTGPFGEFTYVPARDSLNVVAIAVGSGITPLMSMLRKFDGDQNAPKVHLIYGSRCEEEIILKDEIDAMCARNPSIHLTHVLSQPSRFWAGRRGRVDSNTVLDILDDRTSDKTFFICGPESFYTPLADALRERGVLESKIRYESFRTTVAPGAAILKKCDILSATRRFTNNNFVSQHEVCHLSENPALQELQMPNQAEMVEYSVAFPGL